jgi:hypothetical protein
LHSTKFKLVINQTATTLGLTGIAGRCARAASGHAATPPMSMMNSRRFMPNMGTSSPVAWRRRHRA